MQSRFTQLLMQWHLQENDRSMPWKGEKDPYKIWLSEVILQQTRVAQGLAYYERFIKKYPTIGKLAKAADQEVFKLWEGLGYYNRCRNLLHTARQVTNSRNGVFPDSYEEILALKGVGPYTAAAIASFAYDLPYAVVDGNVFRVLSRFFGMDEPIDSAKGKQLFAQLAGQVLDTERPGAYNQAIMDFGALVCKPFAPGCSHCPLQTGCAAFAEGRVNELPVKEKTLQRRHRWFYYFLFEHEGKLLVHERSAKDIWQNLYEFYLLESGERIHWDEKAVKRWAKEQLGIRNAVIKSISPLMQQQLTHQQIRGQFIWLQTDSIPASLQKHKWQPVKVLHKLPYPRFITQYLEKAGLRPQTG
ncbi:A/G-specific adenine glycosylase [Sediminibacterium soli]|uniref:A/G-specific adenine glycosylase n=1 Tax=Sediminibacterium soli TaxID=2698829 RepID=UPI0013799DD1|nr:A/G-specific adenine glycosylase [Sediminibacterium soli]NCI45365.1 A/G-specific adenine glycosylase [Sediminibacterium soli]